MRVRQSECDGEQGQRLSTTAYFYTETLFGRLYWYFFWPFHVFIFDNLIATIEERA